MLSGHTHRNAHHLTAGFSCVGYFRVMRLLEDRKWRQGWVCESEREKKSQKCMIGAWTT